METEARVSHSMNSGRSVFDVQEVAIRAAKVVEAELSMDEMRGICEGGEPPLP